MHVEQLKTHLYAKFGHCDILSFWEIDVSDRQTNRHTHTIMGVLRDHNSLPNVFGGLINWEKGQTVTYTNRY